MSARLAPKGVSHGTDNFSLTGVAQRRTRKNGPEVSRRQAWDHRAVRAHKPGRTVPVRAGDSAGWAAVSTPATSRTGSGVRPALLEYPGCRRYPTISPFPRPP